MEPLGIATPGPESPPVGPTAVVAALPEEIRPLAKRMSVSSRLRIDGCRIRCGRIGRAPVVLAVVGDGRRAAAAGLERLLDAVPVGRVLVVGVAGGLTPDLGPGSLVVSRLVLDGDRHAATVDPQWLARAARVGGAVLGVAVTSDRILVSAADKAATARRMGLTEAATVDLESAALADVAARRGLPCLAVRAVSDAAWENLPLDFEALRSPGGGVSRRRVVTRALAKPAAIPGLFRLRRRVDLCAARLAHFAIQLLDGGPA